MEIILTHVILAPLLIGFILDSLLGDPRWLPHPIVLFGNTIQLGEKKLNKGSNKKLKGAALAIFLILITFVITFIIFKQAQPYPTLFIIIASIGVFYGLANHSLIKEALKVERTLQNQGIEAGRKQLSFIVGRETSNLNKNQIRTAVLETLAENLSDGVIAPLFYYAIGGVPLMLCYKMINTLDSMIGYKNVRYKDFGWFAAKTDDVFNYLPARLTALLMVILTFSLRGIKFIFKFGDKHSSPNAGYPESALSGILNVQFGGPNYYHGQLFAKPYIGLNKRTINTSDLYKTCIINMAVTVASIILIICLNISL